MSDYLLRENQASAAVIAHHLRACDARFVAALRQRTSLDVYAQKIAQHACRFEAWQDNCLIGLVAAYLNSDSRQGFITNVSVLPAVGGKGIGSTLLQRCVSGLFAQHAVTIDLDVEEHNSARHMYAKFGFMVIGENGGYLKMRCQASGEQE